MHPLKKWRVDREPKRPVPPPLKHRRYPGHGRNTKSPMTIAAGMLYSGGVLLCADGQFTTAEAKLEGMKLGVSEPEWGKVVVACSGHVDFAAAAYQQAIRECWNEKPTKAIPALGKSLATFYRDHVYDHPLYEEQPESLGYDFLMGIFLRGEKRVFLYTTTDTTIRETQQFECIGCGVDSARPLISFLRSASAEDNTESYTIALATHVLSWVKRTVNGCGGTTTMRLLRNDGSTLELNGNKDQIISFNESITNGFTFQATKAILHCTDEEPTEYLKQINAVLENSKKFRDWWEEYQSTRVAKPYPQPTKGDQ